MSVQADAAAALPPLLARWEGLDFVALSFVFGLPPAALFSALRGDDGEEAGGEPEDAAGGTPGEVNRAEPGPRVCAGGGDALDALLAELGVREPAATATQARADAARALERARVTGITHVPWRAALYPPRVAAIFDPPLVLWVRGDIGVLTEPAVAIVGSRGASPYGEETAARLASDLARRGVVIVSGLARGIDAAAHRGALAARGRTVAVLGCGADVVYPPEHGGLMEEVVRSGAIVSELPPGTRPLPFHFPRRNRIISALSLGVVIVEARQRSGALITADCALEQGREVMAVPGNVLSERHRGSHTLLKAGAALVETAEDVLQVIAPKASQATLPFLERDPVLAAMEPGERYAADALATACRWDAGALLARLLELELQGLVRREPGGRFVRSPGTC